MGAARLTRPGPLPGPRAGAYLEQMISSDDCTLGSSPRWLSERFSFRRLIRPQGTTEGRDTRQLAERSSSVIWQEMSMSQSRSTQGSLRWDHFTRRAWVLEKWAKHTPVMNPRLTQTWNKAMVYPSVSLPARLSGVLRDQEHCEHAGTQGHMGFVSPLRGLTTARQDTQQEWPLLCAEEATPTWMTCTSQEKKAETQTWVFSLQVTLPRDEGKKRLHVLTPCEVLCGCTASRVSDNTQATARAHAKKRTLTHNLQQPTRTLITPSSKLEAGTKLGKWSLLRRVPDIWGQLLQKLPCSFLDCY